MKDIPGFFLGLIMTILVGGTIISPFYAFLYDIRHDYILSATLDILLFPYGILRGFYLFLAYLF